MSDTDRLKPTQQLILAVLAARFRSGEPFWSFMDRLAPAIAALERAGLVENMGSGVQGATRVALTDAGRDRMLSPTYVSPFEKPIARVRRLCEAAQEDGADLMRLTPTQVLAALDGHR